MRPLLVTLALVAAASTARADDPPAATEPAPAVADSTPPAATPPAALPADPAKKDPYPPMVLGGPDAYAPLVSLGGATSGWAVRVPVRLTGRGETTSAYPIDRYGNTDGGVLSAWPRARVGLVGEFPPKEKPGGFGLKFEGEVDAITGAVRSANPVAEILSGPDSTPLGFELRKAFVTVEDLPYYRVNAGVMTSHWGLGLLANDGDHGWAPGNARFTDPRSGDRVARAQVSTGVISDARIVASIAGDYVLEDDIMLSGAELKPGQGNDTATQLIGALVFNAGQKSNAGGYVVQRWQDAADGRWLRATVFDVAGVHEQELLGGQLKLEAEVTTIVGQTNLAGTIDHPVQDVLQFGAAGRGTLDFGAWGAVLDLFYATGDQNPDDKTQNAFRADPNYEMGLILFRHVLASWTGRTTYTAGDPTLVGYAPPGLERVPNRGSLSNTILFFPRLNFRPMQGLEVFGGVLVALSEVPQVDPFNTRLAGGAPRNALDATPNNHLGTEFDLGVRTRFLVSGVELGVAAEGAVLLPAEALASPTGLLPPIWAGRLILDVRL